MKKTAFLKGLMLAFLLGAGMASCSDDNEATDVPVMRFTTDSGDQIGDIIGGEYQLTGDDEELAIRVLSNVNWNLAVVEGREWLKCDLSEGDGMKEINLTAAEWRIVLYLVTNAPNLITRAQILEECFDYSFESYERVVDTHIKNIRPKLRPGNWIDTVRGYGYRFSGKKA